MMLFDADLASPTAPSRDGTAQTYTLSISVTGPTSLVVGSSSQFFATATLSGGSYGQPNRTEDVTGSATWTSSNGWGEHTPVATVTVLGYVTAH